jgi:hypothetical protein
MSPQERLAGAVPIADLVTATRKRASGKGVGKSVGTLTASLGQTPTKTGSDRQTRNATNSTKWSKRRDLGFYIDQLEGLAIARSWGFESPLPHHTENKARSGTGQSYKFRNAKHARECAIRHRHGRPLRVAHATKGPESRGVRATGVAPPSQSAVPLKRRPRGILHQRLLNLGTEPRILGLEW